MRGSDSNDDIRQTDRYWAALRELERYAEAPRFEGSGSFYAWERLQRLIGRLRAAFDDYELEGDVAPVRREVDAFMADLAGLSVRPDLTLLAQLTAFVDWLEQESSLQVLTSLAPPTGAARWPANLLTVRPETLAAMLAERRSAPVPPGA